MRGLRDRALEHRLRRSRPQPRQETIAALAQEIGARRSSGVRFGFAGVLTASLVVMLGAFGGIGYAASAAKQAIHAVTRVVSPQQAIVVRGLSSGGDQYRPGYGWGDDRHNHTGPPGLRRKGGGFQPFLTTRPVDGGRSQTVSFEVTLDEQAHLFISVVGAEGKALVLNQKGSKVGGGITGKPTKVVQYLALVPRTIPISLNIPSQLLRTGQTYRIRIVARDPQGHSRLLVIPFQA